MAQAKMNRKQEKKMKENLLMLEDERRHADQYKEQAEKVFILVAHSNYSLYVNINLLSSCMVTMHAYLISILIFIG